MILAFLGAGAFGQVYSVTHKFLGRQALKIFPPGSLDSGRDFFHEARVLVYLTHPNVVRVFDANVIETSTSGAVPYLAMEYIEGETVGHLLRRRIRLGLAEAQRLAEDLCAGMSAAHKLEPPLLHLDLTTENVMVTELDGELRIKIADFGIATQVHPTTRMARAQGTYYFMPPEMFWGYATCASDVYMMGFLIYWLYAGVPPYPLPSLPSGATSKEWADAVQRTRSTVAPPITRFRDDVPPALGDVLSKALTPEPDRRFPTAMALSEVIRDLGSSARGGLRKRPQPSGN